ncbi:MAG: DUF697 domain-containing protein [Hyphomonas sp.]|uniref:DUF697 domain-containing protein n=1 Tax=Hyphomonas atlantica TaxID=1280948 RepID=A0A059DYR9_9PROT|nr:MULTISPECIES: DUF697 domain-containing protein [Hyphomonas]KCZ59808.1 hypothetical protein HY36_06675 [Hyphomonas atlantica]MAH94222.1 DUF697 domain-containing protein [Hyphomonas sp.]MAM06886.1 DUF697 domain-containing protein [Hyphomonas sp.]OUX83097.1 MAG: hypothetical protein CBB91_13375 [Hyphomonas sp. TMED31]
MAKNVPAPVDAPVEPAPQWEFASQWSKAWKVLKWSGVALLTIAFLTVIGQGFLFYRIFDDVHPVLGYSFILILAALLLLLVGRPLASFLSMPVAAKPPHTPFDIEKPDISLLSQRLKYDLKYLAMLKRNPLLADEVSAMEEGIAIGRALLARFAIAGEESAANVAADLEAFQKDHIEIHLKKLDTKVDKLIHAEAVGVGVATAFSMNGTVDAFVVLWRNANLIARISQIYFGRPHLGGTLLILRDVAAIVIVSRALEDVTDMTGDVIGGLLGRMGGLIAGPVMDGAVNAMLTLKMGYLAKRRCRAFEGWSARQARSISAEALERVKKESGSVATDLLKRCGGLTSRAAWAAEQTMSGSRNAWSMVQGWFGRKPSEA